MCVYFNRETPWPWLGRLVYFPNLLGWVELRGLPILIHTPNRPSMVGTRDEHVGYNLFCDYSQWHFCIQASQALPLSAGSDKRQTSTLPPRVDETCDVEETGWLANPQHRPCLEGGCPVGMWIFQPASCRTAGHLELGVEARLTGIANSHHPEIEHCIWVGTALRIRALKQTGFGLRWPPTQKRWPPTLCLLKLFSHFCFHQRLQQLLVYRMCTNVRNSFGVP